MFTISAPKWNDEFDLVDGSFSIPAFKTILNTLLKKKGTFCK